MTIVQPYGKKTINNHWTILKTFSFWGYFCDHIHVYDGSETHCDILNSSRDCYKNEEFKLILIKFTFANMDLYMNIWNNSKKLKFV